MNLVDCVRYHDGLRTIRTNNGDVEGWWIKPKRIRLSRRVAAEYLGGKRCRTGTSHVMRAFSKRTFPVDYKQFETRSLYDRPYDEHWLDSIVTGAGKVGRDRGRRGGHRNARSQYSPRFLQSRRRLPPLQSHDGVHFNPTTTSTPAPLTAFAIWNSCHIEHLSAAAAVRRSGS